jgi:small-conductance mechanosensitive channel
MAASFVNEHRNELTAIVTVAGAFLLAELVDRMIARRDGQLSRAVDATEISPETATRLRLVRRLIFAVIVVLGLALAAAQFPSVKRVATGVLASSAVLGLVVGLAARQPLANAIAGILLAITSRSGSATSSRSRTRPARSRRSVSRTPGSGSTTGAA